MKTIGRVHWLLWHLPAEFKKAYRLSFDYAYHHYTFVRYRGRSVFDIFLVMQTSRHYWQVMYCNCETHRYEHFGYRNTKILAQKMTEIWKEGESFNIS